MQYIKSVVLHMQLTFTLCKMEEFGTLLHPWF